MSDPTAILHQVCKSIDAGRLSEGAALLRRDYPFTATSQAPRRYTAIQAMQVFVRDGFIDRYSGKRLIFPGAMRALSLLYPAEFPFHKNWKSSACHFAYYEIFPTVDHIVPVARGGEDREQNWITTSMVRNAAKLHYKAEELGWQLVPPGDIREWDGLTHWFLGLWRKRPEALSGSPYLRRWAQAADFVLDRSRDSEHSSSSDDLAE